MSDKDRERTTFSLRDAIRSSFHSACRDHDLAAHLGGHRQGRILSAQPGGRRCPRQRSGQQRKSLRELRVGILNFGFSALPSKSASDTPFLSVQ